MPSPTAVRVKMPKPVRPLLALVPIVMISICVSAPASAEPIACFRDQPGCGEATVETKVRRSFDRATYVFVGQLESIQDSRSGGSKTRIFTFKIGMQYKGALAGNVVRVSIDSDLTGGKMAGTSPQKSLGEFEQLEAAAESVDTEKAKNQYEKRVASLRDEIQKSGAAESVPVHVVHLNLTMGDLYIRTTDIPMRIGERNAVFVFTKAAIAPDPNDDTGNLSSWYLDPVDLYSMNGERGKRALLALEQASKSKPN